MEDKDYGGCKMNENMEGSLADTGKMQSDGEEVDAIDEDHDLTAM